jgi:DNA-binding transcriptional ArsR family regulator
MEENDALAALTALAHPWRLRVYRLLVGAGPDGLTPGELSAQLGLPASTLSFHLRGLLDGALVVQDRQGRQLYYRPLLPRMQALLDYLSAHCCAGAGCTELDTGIRGALAPGCAPLAPPVAAADAILSKEARCTS